MDPKQNGQGPAPFDPKLKMASDDIKKILEKYDVAGVVILHTPTHTEFLMKVDTTYSLAWLDSQRKFKVKEPEAPTSLLARTDAEEEAWQKQRAEAIFKTLNMMVNLQIVTTNVMVALMQAQQYIRHFFGIKQPPPPPGKPFPPGGKMPRR